jgi:hypothetical protein
MNTYLSTRPEGERNKGARYPKPEPIRNIAGPGPAAPTDGASTALAASSAREVHDLSSQEPGHTPLPSMPPGDPRQPQPKGMEANWPGTHLNPFAGIELGPCFLLSK